MLYTEVSFTGRSWIMRRPAQNSHACLASNHTLADSLYSHCACSGHVMEPLDVLLQSVTCDMQTERWHGRPSTCLMAQRHQLLEVLEFAGTDAVPAAQRKHRHGDGRPPPHALMPEGAVVLHHECWGSPALAVGLVV